MKASELLNQLQALIAEHGDCELDGINDDLRIQGAAFSPASQTGFFTKIPLIYIDVAHEEVCCIHCGLCCADCDVVEDGDIKFPERCPGCGKDPLDI